MTERTTQISGVLALWRVTERKYANFDENGDSLGPGSLAIFVETLPVAKCTPKGWRLSSGRFILASATKRYACPTLEEAFESFAARKSRQASILLARANTALKAKNAAERLLPAFRKTILEDAQPPDQLCRIHSKYASWLDAPSIKVENHPLKSAAEKG